MNKVDITGVPVMSGWLFIVAGVLLIGMGSLSIYYGQDLLRRDTPPPPVTSTSTAEKLPTLSPQQEKLLRLIHSYQVRFGEKKLLITPTAHLFFAEDPPRIVPEINLVEEMFGHGGNVASRVREFDDLIEGMPPEFFRIIPETRPGIRFSVTVTDSGIQYLARLVPAVIETQKKYERQWPEAFTNKIDLSKGVPPEAAFADLQYFMESDDPRVPLEAEIASGPNGEGRSRVSGTAGVVRVMMKEPQTAYYRLAHPKIKIKFSILGFEANI